MKSEDVDIQCTWNVENMEKLYSKIIWKEELAELTEECNLENCFEMMKPPSDILLPCSLTITLKNNQKFHGLTILSEVPMFEVYGDHGEYISTQKGNLLDEINGSSLYEVHISLRKLQSEVIFKCCKVKEKKSLWVYGISVVTKTIDAKTTQPTELNVSSLASMLMGINGGLRQPVSLEKMVDTKMKEVEDRIIKHIDKKFNSLQIKMEENNSKIIKMLSELKEIK